MTICLLPQFSAAFSAVSHENFLVAALRTAGVSASRNPAVVGSAFAVQHAPIGLAARKASTPLSIKMSGQITMPALSSTMKEGKIVQWTKSVGDKWVLNCVQSICA
jgi:hypothetical protein